MPEQWIDDVVGDEAQPRPGFEDRLARELQREWRGGRTPWRAVAWVAAAVVLVVGAAVVLTRDDRSTVVPADTTVPTTAPSSVLPSSSTPTVAGAPYVAIGDSVMLGAKDLLEADNIVVDATENRGAASTVDAIDAAVQRGTIGRSSAVLVQVGTYGPMSQAELDALLLRIPSNVEPILLMTLTGSVDWIAGNNDLIRAAPDRDPRVQVVDWAARAGDVELCPDGIHVSCNDSARQYYADIVRLALGAPAGTTTTTTGPGPSVDPISIGVTRYLTALANGDYDTAAGLLNDGGLEPEARSDMRPLFRPEFGLQPGNTGRSAVAAALEKWCAQALCNMPTDIVDLPDGRWTKAVFPVTVSGDVTRAALFSDYQYEGQTVVTGLPPLLPPASWKGPIELVPRGIVECPVDQVSRVDWADVDGDGWVEMLVSQIVAGASDGDGIVTYRITTCGTTTKVDPVELTGDGLVIYPVNPVRSQGVDTLLIGFAEGYPQGTIYRFDGSRLAEIPGTSWGFAGPVTGSEQRSIGCADLRGAEIAGGTTELVNYTFTETGGRLRYTATSAIAADSTAATGSGDLDASSREAGDIRVGLCDGLPVMTN